MGVVATWELIVHRQINISASPCPNRQGSPLLSDNPMINQRFVSTFPCLLKLIAFIYSTIRATQLLENSHRIKRNHTFLEKPYFHETHFEQKVDTLFGRSLSGHATADMISPIRLRAIIINIFRASFLLHRHFVLSVLIGCRKSWGDFGCMWRVLQLEDMNSFRAVSNGLHSLGDNSSMLYSYSAVKL